MGEIVAPKPRSTHEEVPELKLIHRIVSPTSIADQLSALAALSECILPVLVPLLGDLDPDAQAILATEAAQHVLQQIRKGGFDPNESKRPESARAWLHKVAIRYVLSDQRCRRADQKGLLKYVAAHPEHAPTTPFTANLARRGVEEEVFQGQMRREFLKVLANVLPPSWFSVVYLTFYAGMNSEQIAMLLGKTVGAVDILRSRALKRLRENPETLDVLLELVRDA